MIEGRLHKQLLTSEPRKTQAHFYLRWNMFLLLARRHWSIIWWLKGLVLIHDLIRLFHSLAHTGFRVRHSLDWHCFLIGCKSQSLDSDKLFIALTRCSFLINHLYFMFLLVSYKIRSFLLCMWQDLLNAYVHWVLSIANC